MGQNNYRQLLLLVVVILAAASFFIGILPNKQIRFIPIPSPSPVPSQNNHAPELLKQDCERLVQGQLVFTPQATMREGTPYTVSARLSRGTNVHITAGLDGKGIVIQNALVSCRVSMTLDSQEPQAFTIQKIPVDRADVQVLLPGHFDQWEWRVTPIKSGTLHLLLYVIPMIYIDGVGEGGKPFPQPPRVITVSPDCFFAVKQFILQTWAIWGPLLVVIIPAFLWLLRKSKQHREEKRKQHDQELAAQKNVGFAAAASSAQEQNTSTSDGDSGLVK